VAAAALVASGCGAAAAEEPPGPVPAAVPPAPLQVQPVEPGGVVTPSPAMPAPVRRARAGDGVRVVAFLLPAAADDRAVRAAIDDVRGRPAYRGGVNYFVYDVTPRAAFGDLADVLGVTGTPAVAVIGRDRTLGNRWIGLVDSAMLRQAINDAAATAAATPRP